MAALFFCVTLKPMRPRLLALARWAFLGSLIGLLTGCAGALFLYLLEHATAYRVAQPQIVWLLPLAGLVLGWAFQAFGQRVIAGNNLVLDTYHDGGPNLPLRMGPMVLLGTVWSHLFGASVGREGTGVQMGASLADSVASWAKADPRLRSQLIAAGLAAGLASVFGTPLAGLVFGLEVALLGELDTAALVPALFAALLADWCTRAFPIHHIVFPQLDPIHLDPLTLLRLAALACAVAATGWVFIEGVHALKARAARWLPSLPLRLAAGGALVVLLWQCFGAGDYLGLSTPLISQALGPAAPPAWAFALKLLLTIVSLGFGFIGGEVTPLFVSGACLGAALAPWLGLPAPLAAGVGLAALFGACANVPLAMTVMAVELFGGSVLGPVAWVAVLAWLLLGHRSIYASQRLRRAKHGGEDWAKRPRMADLRGDGSEALPAPKPSPRRRQR